MKLSQLFKSKPKDKFKTATAFTLKGLAKQVHRLEEQGFEKYGEMAANNFEGTTITYEQVMIKKASEE